MRKSLLLATVLALAPTAATAATEWEANFRRCEMDKWFYRDKDVYEFSAEGSLLVTITPADVPALEKGIALLKRCDRFWRCVRARDNDVGKKRVCRIPK